MTDKHTPGPWIVASDETVTVRDAQDGGIASCGWLKSRLTGPRRTSAEVHANARLISAAPDLLEALRAFVEDGFSLHEVERRTDPGTYAAIVKARAAIAKATGEGA